MWLHLFGPRWSHSGPKLLRGGQLGPATPEAGPGELVLGRSGGRAAGLGRVRRLEGRGPKGLCWWPDGSAGGWYTHAERTVILFSAAPQ